MRKQGRGNRGWGLGKRSLALFLLPLFSILHPLSSLAAMPITTDSRIKTFVYNENEVFNVVTHYGYQSNIELAPNEEIMTVSVGDRVGWQIVPAGRRIFIRAMEESAHTNMTVVTSKRAYQFDVREAGEAALMAGEDLVYVIRFYYPDEPGMTPPPPVVGAMPATPAPVAMAPPAPAPMAMATPLSPALAPAPAPAPMIASAPLPAPTPMASPSPAPTASASPVNYNYTFSGPTAAAPVKIYDDGRATYFKFPTTGERPNVAVLTSAGKEMAVPVSTTPEGIAMVNVVAPRFAILSRGQRVVVYNESSPGA